MNQGFQHLLKRVLDSVISVIGLVLLALSFALIALAIKLDSKGPVFFRQERMGKDGRIFKPWKFRTMIVGAVEQGLSVKPGITGWALIYAHLLQL